MSKRDQIAAKIGSNKSLTGAEVLFLQFNLQIAHLKVLGLHKNVLDDVENNKLNTILEYTHSQPQRLFHGVAMN